MLELGLDFVFTVKANQPNVLAQVHEGFHWDCLSAHQSLSCEHGRIETRSIRVADELDPTVPSVDFPGLRFVAQLRRQVESKKDGRKRKPETVYLLTSLPPEQAPPRRLLRLSRCYWGIENRIHWVRDVALREDHSRQLRDLAATAAENAAYQTAHGATALAPEPGRRPAPRLNRLHPLPSARLVGQGPATPAARRALAIRPRSCSAARPSALTHPAHSAHCRPPTRLPHPEQCAYLPSGPNIEFACLQDGSHQFPVVRGLRGPARPAARRASLCWAGRRLRVRPCVWSIRLGAARRGLGPDPVNGPHRDPGNFRHAGLRKTCLEQGLDFKALGCIVHGGTLLQRGTFGRPPF